MKKIFTAMFLLLGGIGYAQVDSTKFDMESFMIGTLDDYMGHQQTFAYSSGDKGYYQMVDIYAQGEKNIALLIDSLFKQKYPDTYIDNNGAPKGIKLYSALMSRLVNSYFKYVPTGSYTGFHDTVYVGILQKDRFVTNQQKLSFIAGAFYRNGDKTGSQECFLSIPNSASKAKICEEFLKDLGCENVSYEIKNNRIPTGHTIFFKPSQKVQSVIDEIEKIKKKAPAGTNTLIGISLPGNNK